MTKKAFKERCSFHTYTGWNGHKVKVNAIFFDYQQGVTEKGERFCGFKFMVKADSKQTNKAKLFDYLYTWATEKIVALPYYIHYRYAETDLKRFKVPLSV